MNGSKTPLGAPARLFYGENNPNNNWYSGIKIRKSKVKLFNYRKTKTKVTRREHNCIIAKEIKGIHINNTVHKIIKDDVD